MSSTFELATVERYNCGFALLTTPEWTHPLAFLFINHLRNPGVIVAIVLAQYTQPPHPTDDRWLVESSHAHTRFILSITDPILVSWSSSLMATLKSLIGKFFNRATRESDFCKYTTFDAFNTGILLLWNWVPVYLITRYRSAEGEYLKQIHQTEWPV